MRRDLIHKLTMMALLVSGAAFVCAPPVLAHQLKVFATAEGRTIQGYAYFPGGGRAADLPVRVLGPQGRELGATRTDDQGRFAFHAQRRYDHRIIVETGTGHRASFVVEAAELPKGLPRDGGETPATAGIEHAVEEAPTPERPPEQVRLQRTVERAISRQLRPLREDLEAYHSRARLHEIIGGIGYIVGIMGLLFFLRDRLHRGKQG